MRSNTELMHNAWKAGLVIPAFNVPFLPMLPSIIRGLRDTECFGFVAVARPEWMKFGAKSVRAVYDEYQKFKDERYTRLHLDHVPVVDEDGLHVDYLAIIKEAVELGYQSVMVDGSRLPLAENIRATRKAAELAHTAGVPLEGELGAVLGHEAGPLPPYEELFATGKGFTDPAEAEQFVRDAGADWLSVAIGNIHGAISGAASTSKKLQARLNIDHLKKIRDLVNIPLVLHGGSGIAKESVLAGVRNGIAKINIGINIRQPYMEGSKVSVEAGQEAVYRAVCQIVNEELEIAGSAHTINPQ